MVACPGRWDPFDLETLTAIKHIDKLLKACSMDKITFEVLAFETHRELHSLLTVKSLVVATLIMASFTQTFMSLIVDQPTTK
jgi:hypothetical protein